MDSLYLLIPLSLLLVLGIGGLLAWSALGGQFEQLDSEGRRILAEDPEHEIPDTNLAKASHDASTRAESVRSSQGADPPGPG